MKIQYVLLQLCTYMINHKRSQCWHYCD